MTPDRQKELRAHAARLGKAEDQLRDYYEAPHWDGVATFLNEALDAVAAQCETVTELLGWIKALRAQKETWESSMKERKPTHREHTAALEAEVKRLTRRECKLCVDYDFDEHDPSCCPHKYGCCGKPCPNCNNKGTPRG